ncbi:MAG: flavin reductase family protein [Paracoccaceae bacterium]|nr:flavin reductase family protein [Paracoccaceae bacterium]
MTRFQPGPESQRAYRDALGSFATGVTVVTTRTSQGPVGITANSFASVSLDPALVLWSPAKSSRRHDAFAGAQSFAIHVLDAAQGAVAEAFVKDGAPFDRVAVRNVATGIPLLDDCLAVFECRRHAAHDAGDHTIIVGEVIAAETRPGEPLLFVQGKYGRFTGAN